MRNDFILLLSFVFLAAPSAPIQAAVLPASRTTVWEDTGIPGGIPFRTQIFVDVTQPPFNAVGDDATDNKAALQSALNACPGGQVVYIPAGIFRVSGDLNVPSNITIRGAGIDQTIIKSTGTGNGVFTFGSTKMLYDPTTLTTSITSGATSGSTSVLLASTTGIQVGGQLVITELNDPAYVSNTSYNGTAGWIDGWNTTGTRARGQIVEVTGIDGHTVTITPALYSAYTRAPWATRFIGVGCKNSGVEDLTVYATNSGAMRNFYFNCAAYCWLYNVKGDFTDGDHVTLDWSFRCHIQQCHFYDAFRHTPGNWDTMIGLRTKTSSCLVIDNIIERLHVSIMTEWGAAGNVIAYNFTRGEYDQGEALGSRALQMGINANHGAHPQFNLFEGNITSHFIADSFWGTSSHNTALRNWFLGHSTSHSPYNARGDPGPIYELTQARRATDIWDGQTSFSIIGNVIGDSTTTDAVFKIISPTPRPYSATKYLWSLGYATTADSGGLAILPSPVGTLIDHGNYDYANQAQTWDPTIGDHNIPDSLFLRDKPAWFGTLTWPPFNPGSPNPSNNSIPASYRYANGHPPPTAPYFLTQPVGSAPSDASVTVGSTAAMRVVVRGYPAPSLQWQESLDGTNWSSLTNNADYIGVATPSLTISAAPISFNGRRYRCVAANSVGGGSTSTSPSATLSVTPRTVTVSAVPVSSKPYDGTVAATVRVSEAILSGVVAGDNVYVSAAAGAFADPNVGNSKAVNVTGLTLAGANAENYVLASSTATSTANITPALVSPSVTVNSKRYDATLAAVISQRALTGLVGADQVSLSGGTAVFSDANVGGTKTVTITGLSLTGAGSPNYLLSSTSGTTTADITPAPVSATIAIADKPYDGTTTATIISRVLTGIIGADSVSLAGGVAAFDTKNAGTAKQVSTVSLTIAGSASTNYQLSATSAISIASITAAPLTVTADARQRNYGAPNPSFSATITGFVNGETLTTSGVAGSALLATTATTASAVGLYAITPTRGTLEASNYSFTTFTAGTLTIAPAPLTVSADSKSKIVGEANPPLTVTLIGFVTGETLATSGVTGAAALSTTATTVSPAGTYPITVTVGTLTANNYAFATFVAGTLTVTPSSVPPPPPPLANSAPSITTQPLSQSAATGTSVSFVVSVTGTPTPTLQWRKDGTAISGATGATLTLPSITTTDDGTYTVVATNILGSVTSNGAVLTLQAGPTITLHPQSQAAISGQSVTFSVTATGSPAPTYQWRKNGAAISGATGSALTLSNLKSSDAGAYDVIVTNSLGSVTSNSAVLIVNAPTYVGTYFGQLSHGGSWALYVRADNTATFIAYLKDRSTGIVVDLAINPDGTFSVIATENNQPSGATGYNASTGDAPGSFPRAAAGVTITISGSIASGQVSGQLSGIGESFTGAKDTGSGSPNSGLFRASALGSATGTTYAVVGPSGQAVVLTLTPAIVDGAAGTVSSNGSLTLATERGAQLALTLNPSTQAIASAYTPAGATTAITFAGVADTVSATSQLVNLSVRSAAGTGDNTLIAGFVVAGGSKSLLIRGIGPTLTGFGVAGAMDDPTLSLYSGTTLIGSNDDWGAGANAAQIASVCSGVGAFALTSVSRDAALLTSLATAAYSAHINGKATAPGIALAELYDAGTGAGRLVNASARTLVGTGANVLIAGFSISGNVPKQVLIRAIGPGLSQFGVVGILADPQLELFQAQTRLQQNDNWAGASVLTAAFTRVAAFALDPNSRDAALLVTLQPATYSAVVSGVNNTIGIALIEVYEVP